MNYTWSIICSLSIIIPAIAGIIMLPKIHKGYYPFILLLWVGFINESVSYFTGKYFRNTAVNSNVYIFLEFFIILWQFYRWHLFDRRKIFLFILPLIFTCIWIYENFISGTIYAFASWSTIISATTIVILSAGMVSRILGTEHKRLSGNPIFIICVCFIIFYAYCGAIEIFWKYGQQFGEEWEAPLYSILSYLNILVYIFYIYALLCMRRKLPFTMLL